MRFSLLFVFVFLSALLLSLETLYAQELSGRVLDEKGTPLPGANVYLPGLDEGVAANTDGRFAIALPEAEPQQILRVRVSFIGYTTLDTSLMPQKGLQLRLKTSQRRFSEEVIVEATRFDTREAPTFVSKVSKAELDQENLGKDLPMLIARQPSVVSFSDAGNGVGYTGLRIRGLDQQRINLTVNGVPVNDPESHGVFWVNFSDLAASTENIQIQRGVGTSTNGSGAFGSSINLQTTALEAPAPYANIQSSYGSFNTYRVSTEFHTGLSEEGWAFNGRASRIESDGFIDRARSDLKSLFLSGGYVGERDILKGVFFAGREETYQAWYGLPQSDVENGIRTRNDAGLRPDGATYDDQVDNYGQDYYQLHYTRRFSEAFNSTTTLFYTRGLGYFEEFHDRRNPFQETNFSQYGLEPIIDVDSIQANGQVLVQRDTITNTHLVRRKWLDNHYYGFILNNQWRIRPQHELQFGGGYNEFDNDHYGRIIWAEYAQNHRKDYEYYNGNGFKTDLNAYAKYRWKGKGPWSALADVQFRRVDYAITGQDERARPVDIAADYNFINPKVGVNYALSAEDRLNLLAGISNREPVRTDFVYSRDGGFPDPERLYDLELGYKHQMERYQVQLNGYYMYFEDQLVPTGELNEVGQPLRRNIPRSFRAGIEAMAQWRITDWLQWDVNTTWSRNRNLDYTDIARDVEDADGHTAIALSPAWTGGSNLRFLPRDWVELSLASRYVGRQYLDNTETEARSLDPYFINDARLYLTWKQPGPLRGLRFSFSVENALDVKYAANGYVFAFNTPSEASATQLQRAPYVYPQAGRHYMAGLELRF